MWGRVVNLDPNVFQDAWGCVSRKWGKPPSWVPMPQRVRNLVDVFAEQLLDLLPAHAESAIPSPTNTTACTSTFLRSKPKNPNYVTVSNSPP